MPPAATKGGGTCLGIPDVCHIPVPPPPPAGPGGVPVPFPNTGLLVLTTRVTWRVLIRNKGICVHNSQIPRSMGDEPGVSMFPTPRGIMSRTNMGKVVFRRFTFKVRAQGKGIVMHTATTSHNGLGNFNVLAGAHMVPSQIKVFVGR
ncbi:type VI secretion protein [Sorangium cellulosum]|uniref:Type VI secretion protein n=1 Tax=Sorangium cellulosum TaxID=56 RepID=A0A2L0EYF6_SORCE|nr:PAAR-like domain-containing protein [Sorangium cellulosum]AUX44351.1 type VI secretion protein [Sorangium cellulosum]